jgi:hypothetical protein
VNGIDDEQVRVVSGRDAAVVSRVRTYASFVRFSHSVFALPFALTGALLAARTQA